MSRAKRRAAKERKELGAERSNAKEYPEQTRKSFDLKEMEGGLAKRLGQEGWLDLKSDLQSSSGEALPGGEVNPAKKYLDDLRWWYERYFYEDLRVIDSLPRDPMTGQDCLQEEKDVEESGYGFFSEA